MASKLEIAYIVVWSFFLASNIDSAFGDLLHVPAQAEVIRGGNITIPCVTTFATHYSVHWQHTPVGSNGAIDIFFTDALIRKFQGKYAVKKDAAKGEYNLTILSALANDAGTYTCIDKGGTGQQRRAELTVWDSQPIGKANVSLDQLAICGTEADYIGLSCDINYAGDQSPNIEWRQIFQNGTEISISTQLPPDVRHDSASYHLAMRIDPSMDGSVLRCQSTLAKYSWTSGKLRIKYALNSSLIVSVQKAEQVRCRATTNQPCSYNWTSADAFQNILSENEILDLASVPIGTYTCMAHCNIRSRPCVVYGQTVQFTGKEKSAPETNSTNFILIGVIVAGILGLIILSIVLGIFCFLRHRKKSKEETEEIAPLLSDENLTPTMDLEKLIVRGIAELDDRIYIIFQEKPIIRVISDLVKFVKEKDIPVIMMEDPWDLESCAKSQCLYVADRSPNCIWKVDPFSKAKPEKWMEGLKKPHKFSVISGGRIAIPKWPLGIEIRKSDGTLAATIELPTDMLEPYYVLETSRKTLVVAHGHQKSAKHRVCEIEKREGDDSDWVVKWSYPEKDSDEINNIDILAMDNEGRIFVTDQNNHRVIVLSESGENISEIVTKPLPYRLCYARNNKLLLVGHFRAISVYKVKDIGGQLKIQHIREAVCKSFPFDNLSTTRKSAQNLAMHLDNDSVKTMEIGENTVRGIAQLYNKFYVIFQDKNLIRVFDESGEKLRDIPVQNLSDPWFIGACPKNNCLYITDKGRECIVKVSDLDRKDGTVAVEIWKAKISEPYKLSVISDGCVLIPTWPATLEVYDSQSQLKDEIVLPDDMREPCHAVEADRGSYILGHGDKKSDTHRVCKITYSNRKGCEVVWKYGNQRGNQIGQLNRPRNIAIGEKSRVFITDEGNRRLVVLDENGNRLSTETTNITTERFFYSKSIGRLLVGHYGSMSQYVVDEDECLKCCPSAGCFTCATDA